MRKERSQSRFVFLGNHRCLDFINTQLIKNSRPADLLERFHDLVSWMMGAQILDPTQAKEAIRRWGGQPEGDRVFEQARAFRETLRQMVEKIVRRRTVPSASVAAVNALLRRRWGYRQLVLRSGRFEIETLAELGEPINLLIPIGEAAADLLSRGDLSLIKRCQNRDCVLYFYDTTKNHARRWCSMRVCGNRMKVAAHYRRKRMARTR